MVIREDIHTPERIPHAGADGAGRDQRMSDRKARLCRPYAPRGIAERHDPAGDSDLDRHAVEGVRQPREPSPFRQDEYAGTAVRQRCDRGSHHSGGIEELSCVAPQCRERAAEIGDVAAMQNGWHDGGTGGRIWRALGASVPNRRSGNHQEDDGGASEPADRGGDHSDSR